MGLKVVEEVGLGLEGAVSRSKIFTTGVEVTGFGGGAVVPFSKLGARGRPVDEDEVGAEVRGCTGLD